jgi:hypothetical protein
VLTPRALRLTTLGHLLSQAAAMAREASDLRLASEAVRLFLAHTDLETEMTEEACRAALRFLATSQPITSLLAQRPVAGARLPQRRSCRYCGESVITIQVELPLASAAVRWQGQCHRCGIAFNVEEGSRFADQHLELREGRLVLSPALVDPTIQGVLIKRTWDMKKTRYQLFPTSSPLPAVTVEPRRATTLSLVVMADLEVAYIRRLYV